MACYEDNGTRGRRCASRVLGSVNGRAPRVFARARQARGTELTRTGARRRSECSARTGKCAVATSIERLMGRRAPDAACGVTDSGSYKFRM